MLNYLLGSCTLAISRLLSMLDLPHAPAKAVNEKLYHHHFPCKCGPCQVSEVIINAMNRDYIRYTFLFTLAPNNCTVRSIWARVRKEIPGIIVNITP